MLCLPIKRCIHAEICAVDREFVVQLYFNDFDWSVPLLNLFLRRHTIPGRKVSHTLDHAAIEIPTVHPAFHRNCEKCRLNAWIMLFNRLCHQKHFLLIVHLGTISIVNTKPLIQLSWMTVRTSGVFAASIKITVLQLLHSLCRHFAKLRE